MVNISIDVTDLGGEARPGDKVVFWRPRMGGSATHAGRVISTAPVTVFLTDGKATVSDVEPGEMTVLLQCRGVESQGPVTVGVPDGNGTVTLRSLIESQFEYAPPIVSAVQEAASNASASEEAAIRAQIRSEAAADRADAKVDDAINNGANLIRNEVKQDADRAVSARQAATQSESNAAASEVAAASSASNAKTSETNAKRSEDNAGDYAAVATTAATEAVDAMSSVSDIIGANYATREYVDSKNWVKRDFVSGEDLNEVTDPGLYTMPSYARANTLLNKPTVSNAVDRGATEVLAGGGAVQQTWYPMGIASRTHMPVMRRRRDNAGTWTEWEQINAKVDVPDYDPLEAVGMTATGASGELTGLRSVLRDLNPGAAPVWSWWAPAPTEELEMPTHDGGGQTCHPSVLYFPSGWNGWKYWMAHTPYPNFQESHEDPNIAVSNDGTTWQEPEGLTNPLDDGLGRPNYHNSDTHLVMNGNTMVVTWRTVDRPNGGQNIIYARTSTDGVNWTDKTEVLKVPLGTAESTFVAQSLVKMPTGWRLYGIRSMYGPNRLGYYETSVNTIPKTSDWGAAQDCDLGEIPTGRDPWHSEVQRLSADDWVAIISDGKRGSTGVDGDIYLATSTDGVEWDVSPLPLTPRANGVINSLYKTGFVVSGTGANRKFDLWVSGYRTDKRTWGIYRTLAEHRGSSHAEALPITRVGTGSPEGKVAAPVGSVYTDSAATNGAIRWVKASGTGSTGWRDDYGDTIDALEAKADKSEVADARWWKTPALAKDVNFDEVRDPSIRIMLGGTHTSAPFNALGTLEVLPTGYNGVIQRATNWGTLEVWKRRTQGGVFQAWAKEPTLADINAVKTLIPSAQSIQNTVNEALSNIDIPGATTDWARRVPLAVTTGAGPSEGPGSGRYRMKVQFTAPIIRWRLHISTEYTIGGTPGSASTLWLVRVGNHTGNAVMGQSTELMSRSVAVPEGGEWVSGWTNHRLDTESIIDVSFTASGSTRNFLAPAWKLDGSTWVQTNRAPLWVWIEAETYKDTPSVALIGDSTGAGHGSVEPVWDSAVAIAGRKQEFLPVLFASSGDTLAGNVSINDPNFVRWSDYGTYDSVVIQAGSNDINSGKTLAEVQASFTSVAAVAKELGVKVYGATIKPRYPTDTSPDVRAPYNEWLKTLPAGISGVIDYDGAVAPDGVILPEDNDDGSHLKSSGHHKMATAYSFPIARPRVVGVWKS